MRAVLDLYKAVLRLAIVIPLALYEELREEPFDYESRTSWPK